MFADVILPLPLSNTFTYAVPTKMRDKIGKGYRVIVPFGKRKYYTAVVAAIHEKKPKTVETKEIYALIDHHPIVNEYQLKLWEWISFTIYRRLEMYIKQQHPLNSEWKAKLASN